MIQYIFNKIQKLLPQSTEVIREKTKPIKAEQQKYTEEIFTVIVMASNNIQEKFPNKTFITENSARIYANKISSNAKVNRIYIIPGMFCKANFAKRKVIK